MQPFETIYVDTMVAACNGGGGPLGHPKVYLNLSAEGKVECPYCSRLFIHRSHKPAEKAQSAAQGHVVSAPSVGAAPKP
jgi:uncharacterized Zn-finger protein